MAQIKKSPDGKESSGKFKIVIEKNGPYVVSGGLPLAKEIIISDDEDNAVEWRKGEKCRDLETYELCRCGHSQKHPYCDDTHKKISFDGTETAAREKYDEQAEVVHGPSLDLTDVPPLCAGARFCHNKQGRVWDFTRESDNPKSKEVAIQEACDCPAGRLVAWDKKTGKPIEPHHAASISIVEDPARGVSGPLWVKGGVPIESADGKKYETRNRVTLCRCGKSRNKPFCDASHVSAGFTDGDESLGN